LSVKRIVAATGALGEKNEKIFGHWFEFGSGADEERLDGGSAEPIILS